MPKKRPFIIGTPTTPRKQAAISKARKGLLDTTSWEYVKAKYRSALLPPLRSRMYVEWWTGNDVWDFAEECVEDAFTRINEYNPAHKFRTFLAEIIIKPKLDAFYKSEARKREAEKDYAQQRRKRKPISAKNLADEIKPNLEKGIARDVLRQLKAQDEMKYEVFCYREFDGWEYKDIADEWGITPANACKIYERVKKQEIPQIFGQLINSAKYMDKDMKIRQTILNILRKEIKEK